MTPTSTLSFRLSMLARGALAAALAAALTGCGWFGDDDDKKPQVAGNRLNVVELEEGIKVDPRISDVQVILPQPSANSTWAQPGGVPTHALQHLRAGGAFERLWRSDIGAGSDGRASLTAVPIVAEGKVYTLDTRSRVRAFNTATGDRLWQVELAPEDEDERAGFGGGVAFNNGRLFVTTGFGDIVALDAQTGEELWKKSIGLPIRAAPTVTDDKVYVISTDNKLTAYAWSDGTTEWSERALVETAGVLSATSPATDGEIVVAPFSSGELLAFRVQNGAQVWSDTLTRASNLTAMASINDISARPVIDDTRVVAVSHSGRMVIIDKRTGERIWTRNIASVHTPWVAGDWIFVITTEQKLLCVSARDGRVRWMTQLPAFDDPKDQTGPIVWTAPVLVSNRLFIAGSEEEALLIAPSTGEILEKIDLPDKAFIQPVVADETIYLLLDDGDLLALR